jgi:hypothetical protein
MNPMSHVVTIETKVRDRLAVDQACRRLGLPAAESGTFQLFSDTVSGLAVQLRGWRYPVVCALDSGELRLDNYMGRWGSQLELDRFLQMYAVEMARIEARKQGHTVTEQQLPDGSVKLTIQVGGAQ